MKKEELIQPDIFIYFIRKQYKTIKINYDESEELRKDFIKYLQKLNLTEEQKENIIPKSLSDILMNTNHPFRIHGFPSGYALHFSLYIEKMRKRAQNNTEK